jgi:hypothetical protein
MEVNEGIALIQAELKEKCDHTVDKTSWKCVMEGQTTNSLVPNIKRDRDVAEPTWPAPNGGRSIKDVSRGASIWPHQAHHLIPWQQLQDEPASRYLDSKKNAITGPNNYSVNHGNNGLFMPYSADLAEWDTTADQQELSEKLMDLVLVQLHQSRHSFTQYEGAEQGYKARVKQYLKTISDNGLTHTAMCPPCQQKQDGKKLPPRANIVSAMDRASRNLERDIGDLDIFVSRRAATWAKKRGS